MNVPPYTAEFVAQWEGFRSHAYKCPAGVWTVGYGTTVLGDRPVRAGDYLTAAEAMAFLRRDLGRVAAQIRPSLMRDPSEHQWAAMLSLAYNIGAKAFRLSSVRRKFNLGDPQGAADAFLLWNKAGGKVLKGLVRRREAERRLFLSTEGFVRDHIAGIG